jgi:hypothetical protein
MAIVLHILKIPYEILISLKFKGIHSLFQSFLFILLFLFDFVKATCVNLFLLSDHLNFLDGILICQDRVKFYFTLSICWLIHYGVSEPQNLSNFHAENYQSISKNDIILTHTVISWITVISLMSRSFNTVNSCELDDAKSHRKNNSQEQQKALRLII